MSDLSARDQIIDIIKKEIIGPNPIDSPNYVQPNGEEILTESPRIKYSAGILYPRESLNEEIKDDEKDTDGFERSGKDVRESDIQINGTNHASVGEILADSEEAVKLSNAYNQSAISITSACKNIDKISVMVKAAIYERKVEYTDAGKKRILYYRRPMFWNNSGEFIELPDEIEKIKKYQVSGEGNKYKGLELIIINRKNTKVENIYTFSLINKKRKTRSALDEDCFFQVGFSIKSNCGFLRIPSVEKEFLSEDDASNELLYRNEKNYAIGHGCSANWEDEEENVFVIRTEIIPTFDLKPILPTAIKGVSLSMKLMSDLGDFDRALYELNKLVIEYKSWIKRIETESMNLPKQYGESAKRHIALCKESMNRMKKGIELLERDEKVRTAFQYMNRAMLMQQLHFNMPTSLWDTKNSNAKMIKMYNVLPDIEDESTWYGDASRYGKWRPFQIAFILMNLISMNDAANEERSLVDLIWFPTGGGKTEAYLGLSAYTIFLRRLKNKEDAGTAILMRYTLRLLTTQQYQRAASLICSCEMIRQEKISKLGDKKITIGLWVGNATTPKKMADAVKVYEKLKCGKTTANPFIVLKCPWCGAQMGVFQHPKGKVSLRGYKKNNTPKKHFVYQCSNTDCQFSVKNNALPMTVIDEEIYEEPPTLLLGTVDKFAMLPYIPKAQRLFGINCDWSPPELIIQDELHLISGPLGTMVGHYETLIDELCTKYNDDGSMIKPKIIASTATIRNASDQCHALYNCGKNNVKQFPPMGINAGDSFFAKLDHKAKGRKYVGIFAPGSSSFAMTNIRLYATLLYAAKEISVKDESERDPYWTNLGYYNSLRELGQTATWINADIEEYLHTIYGRKYIERDKRKDSSKKIDRRYIYRFEELTSRISNEKIPMSLENLSVKYPNEKPRPVDICLATNMVSVGVDIPRLGLMTVVGQPKTTSEYIQATSRVGRSNTAPGLVFVTYSPGKPRDKSHYEQFKAYHMKIYSQVEPTSVTPFSERVRERAMHALIIGYVRLFGDASTYDDPRKLPDEETKKRIYKMILDRVENVAIEEKSGTKALIDYVFKHWETFLPQQYHTFVDQEDPVLMYPSSMSPNEDWNRVGFSTPTSMRNVDAACEIRILNKEVNE